MSVVAFIGLGLMGSPMAENLSKSSEVSVLNIWNRTFSKSEELQKKNPEKIKSFHDEVDAIKESELIYIMLSDFPTIKSIFLSERIQNILRGKAIVNMSTIGRKESIEFAKELHSAGAFFVEAPVLGSTPVAISGKLQFLITCNDLEYFKEKIEPSLLSMGNVKFREKEYGKSSLLKLALNNIIASTVSALSFSLALLQKGGISSEPFMDIIRNSLAYSQYLDMKYPFMIKHNYEPVTFPEKLVAKDVGLMEQEGKELGVDTVVVEAIKTLALRGVELGWGEVDFSSLFEAVLKNQK